MTSAPPLVRSPGWEPGKTHSNGGSRRSARNRPGIRFIGFRGCTQRNQERATSAVQLCSRLNNKKTTAMETPLHQLINSRQASSTLLVLSAADLKALTDTLVTETRRAVEEQQRPVYLTREEVMQLLHISNGTLYNFVRAGKLNPVMVGDKKRYIRSEIDEAIRKGQLAKYIHK